MTDFIINNEGQLRLGVFATAFLLMALLETLMPKRIRSFKRSRRWFSNLSILFVGAMAGRFLLPMLPVGAAFYAEETNAGLFNQFELQGWLFIVLGILILDLMIYVQHIIVHKVPVLWRLHRLHHADLDYDVTTGIRFHPIEIVLSLIYKVALIYLFGIDPLAVLLFEMILNGMAMFNHANFALPPRLDAVLRLVFVTPDFHRVHHSSIQTETDSNYGFNISLWDRLFKTYTPQPQKGHQDMEIGLEYLRDEKELTFLALLVQPFKKVEK